MAGDVTIIVVKPRGLATMRTPRRDWPMGIGAMRAIEDPAARVVDFWR
jgi:hypothetical protein